FDRPLARTGPNLGGAGPAGAGRSAGPGRPRPPGSDSIERTARTGDGPRVVRGVRHSVRRAGPLNPRTRWLSPGPPSGENVGWLVVDEPVIELRQQPAKFVVEAAVAGVGGVAGEGAAAHGRRTGVVEAAAAGAGGVAGEGAAAH